MSPSAIPSPGSGCVSGPLSAPWSVSVMIAVSIGLLLLAVVAIQHELDDARGRTTEMAEELRLLPRGEILKPALLGYHHVGADLLWLRIVQVLGESHVSSSGWEWLNHALDVITTLDPQYVYAYDAGGTVLADLANRVDWSNRLLEKGAQENPTAWRLPFLLAYNHFFHLQDYVQAAKYMAQAARLPGHPAYVPGLAARLYVEGKNPQFALSYLETLMRETHDASMREILEKRYKEVLIEWHIQVLQQALEQYTQKVGAPPSDLAALVRQGLISALPQEPFEGEYRIEKETGRITSTTHPERMRLYRPADAIKFQPPPEGHDGKF